MGLRTSASQAPYKTLSLVFVAWKVLLFLVAALAPGPGYDTSGLILYTEGQSRHNSLHSQSLIDHLLLNLFRWDALYIVKAAERGYAFEQEWAFSWAFSRSLGQATRCKVFADTLPLTELTY